MTTKWKIQVPTLHGWGDQKASIGGGPYELETFNSYEEAKEEGDDAASELDDFTFRVVPVDIEQDDELYDE